MDRTGYRERRRLRVHGVVQGVGFRPFVHALATQLRLTGFVGNDSLGVFIEAEGDAPALAELEGRLVASPPPLAVVDRVETWSIPCRLEESFLIVESLVDATRSTPVSPDVSVCDACLRELMSPHNRRYRYPFINCTHCGPRFSIIRKVPYDRAGTTMRRFTMCAACEAEYRDPESRRFHAQPNACGACGPRVWFSRTGTVRRPSAAPTPRPERDDENDTNEEAIARCKAALDGGAVVAIKGIGGFHLACDARSEDACRRLRERKGRVDKPFAVMARDLDAIRRFAVVSPDEERVLRSKERPIVLLSKRACGGSKELSPLVAPGNRTVGTMLPYSPLHYLLLGEAPLVMTSGNRSEEPIVKDNDEAERRLSGLVDGFLFHDRDIEIVCDDSVVRVFQGRELPLRRSRGYAPLPLRSPIEGPSVLAVGGELKATFCLTKDGIAYESQHIGDMGKLETLDAFERAVDHLRRLFAVTPRAVVCDLHPGYLSSSWARRYARRGELPLVEVQHHHAHIASLLGESGSKLDERVIGLAFDGTGYGTDGAVWGFEVLDAGYETFERLGHAKYVPLPGGDAAIRKPYRTALAYLTAAGIPWDHRLPPVMRATPGERRLLARQLEGEIHCARASSLGRLFDAVSALAGVRQEATYEAQAAIELEAVARIEPGLEPYAFAIERSTPWIIDPAPVLEAVVRDRLRGESADAIAGRFHLGVADLVESVAAMGHEATGLGTVALSGGVFQNVLLLSLAQEKLERSGFRVMRHRVVPPNDGGLALGQALVATARLGRPPAP